MFVILLGVVCHLGTRPDVGDDRHALLDLSHADLVVGRDQLLGDELAGFILPTPAARDILGRAHSTLQLRRLRPFSKCLTAIF